VNIINNYARPDWSTSNLAKNWNEALVHGFEDLLKPACEKVIAVQADARINPEWYNNILNISPEIKFMSCGHGDEFLMFTPECVIDVGMFDERFSISALHELDYYLRCRSRIPQHTCIIDVNSWAGTQGFLKHNIHGLSDTDFILPTYKCGHNDEAKGGMHYHDNYIKYFEYKYGKGIDSAISDTKYISHTEHVHYPYFEKNIKSDVYILENNIEGERVIGLLDTYKPPSQRS